MGLTSQSTGLSALREASDIQKFSPGDIVIALAGNPNTGKSTVFNSLTGLNQHTGNWTGKTVATAQGSYRYEDKNFILVDLPGTYSLLSNSAEEEVARDFICFGNPHATVVVTDATCLERNLNLVPQILEMTDKVVVCVNLMDEAKRKKIRIDLDRLSQLLGVPVVGTNARSAKGLKELMDAVYKVALEQTATNPVKVKYNNEIEKSVQYLDSQISSLIQDKMSSRWLALKLLDNDAAILDSINRHLGFDLAEKINYGSESAASIWPSSDSIADSSALRDEIVTSIVALAEDICSKAVKFENENYLESFRHSHNDCTSRGGVLDHHRRSQYTFRYYCQILILDRGPAYGYFHSIRPARLAPWRTGIGNVQDLGMGGIRHAAAYGYILPLVYLA